MRKPDMRVAVVHCTGKRIALGDRSRVEKILENLRREGFEVIDIHLPPTYMIGDYVSTASGLKNLYLSTIPLNKLSTPAVALNASVPTVFKYYMWINVSINHLRRMVSKVRPDAILAETSFLVGWVTSLLAEKLSIPCVIDVHGLSFAESKGGGKKNWLRVREIEMQSFQKCTYLSVVSNKTKEYMIHQLGLPTGKIIVAPNGSDPQPVVAKYECPLKVIYTGNLAYWEKIDDLLEIAKSSDSEMFRFLIAGAGSLKEKLISRIRSEKIPVRYLGYIPRTKIFSILSRMQIGIAPSTRDLARIVASPIKVFDYMASGLPVITPKIGDWGDIVDEEDCGMALSNDSIDNYVKALNTLAEEGNWTRRSSNSVMAIEKKYNWDKTLEPLVKLLSSFS